MKNIKLLGLVVVLFLSGYAMAMSQGATYSHFVNFNEMLKYAKRANVAYENDAKIKKEYGKFSKIYIGEGKKWKLKWFVQVENIPSNKTWITIRGTHNSKNAISDLRYIKVVDKISNIPMHKGFLEATREIYDDIKSKISKKDEVHISGHSLGAAAAVISMIWLTEEGYDVKFCYTFGQPKITTKKGAKKYESLPLVRVINQGDPALPLS